MHPGRYTEHLRLRPGVRLIGAGGPAFERVRRRTGGPAGNWYGQTITLQELEGMFEGIPIR